MRYIYCSMSTKDHNRPELPPRLQTIADLLRKGMHEKEIAEQLSLSEHTIHTYTRQIYKIFGVRGRIKLMGLWLDQA